MNIFPSRCKSVRFRTSDFVLCPSPHISLSLSLFLYPASIRNTRCILLRQNSLTQICSALPRRMRSAGDFWRRRYAKNVAFVQAGRDPFFLCEDRGRKGSRRMSRIRQGEIILVVSVSRYDIR